MPLVEWALTPRGYGTAWAW